MRTRAWAFGAAAMLLVASGMAVSHGGGSDEGGKDHDRGQGRPWDELAEGGDLRLRVRSDSGGGDGRDDKDEDTEDEDGDGNGDGDDREAEDDRDDRDPRHEALGGGPRSAQRLRIEHSDGEARLEVTRVVGGEEAKVRIRLDADRGRVEVAHHTEANGSEEGRKLRAALHALAEFRDADGDGAYDQGEEVVSLWHLGDRSLPGRLDHDLDAGQADWQPLEVGDVDSADGRPGKLVRAQARLGGGGAFAVDLRVFGEFAEVDGVRLEPTEAKIDFRITDYPFVANDTMLALFVTTEAKEELERRDGALPGEEALMTPSEGLRRPSLVFTWADFALVDGARRGVHDTLLATKEEVSREQQGGATEEEVKVAYRFALAYPRGDRIVHDPVVGARYGTASEGMLGVPGPGAWVPLLAAVAVAVAKQGARRPRA